MVRIEGTWGHLAKEERSMALNISPVHRNLHTRVSFLYLEFEDWFVVIGLAALTNIFGRWVDRQLFGIPMNVFLQYIVPVLSIPFLMLFKYGKPGGYLKDLLAWHTKPRIYCGLEPDSGMKLDYFKEEEIDANRSEEHTSELQSHVNLVCRLL